MDLHTALIFFLLGGIAGTLAAFLYISKSREVVLITAEEWDEYRSLLIHFRQERA